MEDKKLIKEGYQWGKLIIIDKTEQRKNGYMIWKCVCECGNTIFLDTRKIQRQTVFDCGCITKIKPGRRDITGLRFGKLVAEYPLEGYLYGSALWHCRCDCGGEIDTPLKQLTCGYRKSCGCLSKPKLQNLVGNKYHMLTVYEYAGKIKRNAHYWNCRCECGNTTTVRQDYLKSGKTKSCGCISGQLLKERMKFVDGTSVTMLESVQKKLRSNNKSGYTGVYQDSKNNCWHARIVFQGKVYDFGTYKTKDEAICVREKAEELHKKYLENYYNENM